MTVSLVPDQSQENLTRPQTIAVLRNLRYALETRLKHQFGPSTQLDARFYATANNDGSTGHRLFNLMISGTMSLSYSGPLSDVAIEVARQQLLAARP